MPATLDPIDIVEDAPPVNEQERAQMEMQAFTPPKVRVGSIVKWFRDADPGSAGYVAILNQVGDRCNGIQILNLDCPWLLKSVHHIDDPTLKYRPGTRINGAWDYLPEHKELSARIDALEARLSQGGKLDSERVAAMVKKIISEELGETKKK